MGRAPGDANCPFCTALVSGFAWSVAGSGKKCACGAVLGMARAAIERKNCEHCQAGTT